MTVFYVPCRKIREFIMRDLDEAAIIDIIGEILSKALNTSSGIYHTIRVDQFELLQMQLDDTTTLLPILIDTENTNCDDDDREYTTFGEIDICNKTYKPDESIFRTTNFDTAYFRQFKQINVKLKKGNRPKKKKFNIFCELICLAIEIIDNL